MNRLRLAALCFFLALCCSIVFAKQKKYCAVCGCSDNCENPSNYQPATCQLKWANCSDGSKQKPPPFDLCTTNDRGPSGLLPTDWYTFAVQESDEQGVYTLHGLWPGSSSGSGSHNQPYGCMNGEQFEPKYLTSMNELFKKFWPTNPQFKNTQECFIMHEWMKHGTCAVIPGNDGTAFRITQELYYRTAMVLLAEFNANEDFGSHEGGDATFFIDANCVQCAYFGAIGWNDYNPANVPRLPSFCADHCYACDKDTCNEANLNSAVTYNPDNAPRPPAGLFTSFIAGPAANFTSFMAVPGALDAERIGVAETNKFPMELDGGVWRSFGAEQLGSGKFEFAQVFSAQENKFTSTTDSPYPNGCTAVETYSDPTSPIKHVALHNCGQNKHSEYCLYKRLPDIGGLEVAFFACNHSGGPSPVDFPASMDTPSCGNFLMFRCKSSAQACSFSPVSTPVVQQSRTADEEQLRCSLLDNGTTRVPNGLLGSWRTLEVSAGYNVGLARWNFTADGQATQEWPNYPSRGVQHFTVSTWGRFLYLTNAEGNFKACLFDVKYDPVYSYAVLACGYENGPAPASLKDGFKHPNTQWAMGRCNGCSRFCHYSCGSQNDNCGVGSCDPSEKHTHTGTKKKSNATSDWEAPNWCKPGDTSCWPTETDIKALELKLGPNDDRTALKWALREPQPAPVPLKSINDQALYGLGHNDPKGIKALYYYKDLEELKKPCYTGSDANAWNYVSDMCKAATRQNEYRNWNPFIVVFPLNERHIHHALEFAIRHRLCIAVSGTGHEYVSRNMCPTGGILIRTILLKSKKFLPTWNEDPALSPHGAFKFGAGSIFSEMHNFSAQHNRVVSSGWCATVGMVGWHLGGGHGPFAPSLGLGVDNLLEVEMLQIGEDQYGRPVIHKKVASRKHNSHLFWAMRGGGGSVWGVILSMTVRAHAIPEGGLSRVYMEKTGTFCDQGNFGYKWLPKMWNNFGQWVLSLNEKVSTQPGFFINTDGYKSGGLCNVTWTFKFEYFYAGGQNEPKYKTYLNRLAKILEVPRASVEETHFNNVFEYLLSMPANKFALTASNPVPSPSDSATGSQNSVFVSRKALQTQFTTAMMSILDICVQTLALPDTSSPVPDGSRCGFHYLYTSVTGNIGSKRPGDTAIAPAFRNAVMLWNARTLTTQQVEDTLYKIGQVSYYSESSYVLHNWTTRYWGSEGLYQQLLAVKKAHDPGNHFWCHHCVGDNPESAYGIN